MCRAFEELAEKYSNEKTKENATRLLKRGILSNEQIAEDLNLDIEVVKTLAEELADGTLDKCIL